jgi:hypothetical protein
MFNPFTRGDVTVEFEGKDVILTKIGREAVSPLR